MRRPSLTQVVDAAPLALAILLRLLLPITYATDQGYDFWAHFHHIEYIAQHHTLAPIGLNNATYHPPLFYLLAAGLHIVGLGAQALIVLPVVLGIARLVIFFFALRRFLPQDRLARALAMTLAGLLPCGLLLDGMLTNEALLGPLALLALLLLPRLFASPPQPLSQGVPLGLTVGAMLLTKISALLVVMLIGLGTGLVFVSTAADLRLRRVGPLLVALALCGLCSLPHALRAKAYTGTMFPTAFDALPRFRAIAARALAQPFLDRRPLGYVFGLGDGDIFWEPFTPTAIDRFSVTLVATSFVDYYNYGFAGMPHPGERHGYVNARPMPWRVLWLQRGALIGGMLIAVATIAAWAMCLRALFLRRDHGLLLVLLLPLLAVLGQLHFAIKYPIDNMGMVKGHYMQFAAAPLFALYGIAMSFLWRRARSLFLVEVWALALVALYTLGSRRLVF